MRLFLLVEFLLVALTFPTLANGQRLTPEDRVKLHDLVEKGQLAEALEYSGRSARVQELQLSKVFLVEEKQGAAAAIVEAERFFQHFPMGQPSNLAPSVTQDLLLTCSKKYAELLNELGRNKPGSVDYENIVAVGHYEKFTKSLVGVHKPTVAMLDDMLNDCPRSWLIAPAIYRLASRDLNGRRAELVKQCEARVLAKDPSPRLKWLLKLVRALIGVNQAADAAAYIELSQESTVEWEQRNYMLMAANSLASYRSTKEQRQQGLEIYEKLFKEYPNRKEMKLARVGYVDALLATSTAETAFEKLRALEDATPGSLYLEPYFTIGRSLEKAQRYGQALELLNGLMLRASEKDEMARILDSCAKLQLKAGKQEAAFQSYQQAAQMWMDELKLQKEIEAKLTKLRADLVDAPFAERHTATSPWDQKLSDSFNRMSAMRAYCEEAVRVMGDHCLAEKRFEESLGYWEAWQNDSKCGLGRDYWQGTRDLKMALCRLHLGQFDTATQAMNTWLKHRETKDYFRNRNLMLMAEVFRQADQLDALKAYAEKSAEEYVSFMKGKYDYMKKQTDEQVLERSNAKALLQLIDAIKETDLSELQKQNTHSTEKPEVFYANWDWAPPKKGTLKLPGLPEYE